MATAITDAELLRSLSEMLTPGISVPAAERAGWFRSMGRLSRIPHPDARFPVTKLAGAWLKLATLTWGEYPSQDDDDAA